MNTAAQSGEFSERLSSFRPKSHAQSRSLALFSAAIALADPGCLDRALTIARTHRLSRSQLYEMLLQSYLFLGFPRMLLAAEHLDRRFATPTTESALMPIGPDESQAWFQNGLALCRQVYGDNYESLKERVESFAPEIFRWMVLEGYGKVLSRPGLSPVDRELGVVACLLMENRQKQLHSHIRGARNVGASPELLRLVIDDVGAAAGDGYQSALALLARQDGR